MRRPQQGFTLIELLVVIAIIGILSAIVLASLNTARKKASDALIQSDLSTIRSQSELYHTKGNVYGTNTALESSCTATDNMFSDSNIQRAAAGADSANGSGTVTCNVSAHGTAYAVEAQLVSDPAKYWCVDSASVGTTTTQALGTATVCP